MNKRDITYSNSMVASPSVLREEAQERLGQCGEDFPLIKEYEWVANDATDEQLNDIADYALSNNDELWTLFFACINDAICTLYPEFVKDLDATTDNH